MQDSKDDTKGVCYPKRKNSQRIVVVGDVHGAYDGLLEVLYHANITADKSSCVWKKQPVKTLLVQVGDLVDRGPGALESFACLRKLQTEAPKFNGTVVRLLGSKFAELDFLFSIIESFVSLLQIMTCGGWKGFSIIDINKQIQKQILKPLLS